MNMVQLACAYLVDFTTYSDVIAVYYIKRHTGTLFQTLSWIGLIYDDQAGPNAPFPTTYFAKTIPIVLAHYGHYKVDYLLFL
jgi:hypothetical protein